MCHHSLVILVAWLAVGHADARALVARVGHATTPLSAQDAAVSVRSLAVWLKAFENQYVNKFVK